MVTLSSLVAPSGRAFAQCELVQKITAPDAAADQFGDSISVNGDTALVGAPKDDCAAGTWCGAAYVYRFNGVSWLHERKLTASDAAERDQFGHSVSVSGDTAVVGAFRDDCAAGQDCGAAYIYRFNGTSWAQEQKLTALDAGANDEFGHSVSVIGDTVVVAARQPACAAGVFCGSAYVFRFNGTSWVEEQKLTPPDAEANEFGFAVRLSGNTLVVGAPGYSCAAGHTCGAAYVYRFNGTSWIEEQMLTAPDAAEGDWFGRSVAVSWDTAVVGVLRDDCAATNACGADDNCGSAYVYRFDGTSWIEEQKLTASDAAAGDSFGISVSVQGDSVVVGAYSDECMAGNSCGAAYVYRFNGTSWGEVQKLTAPNPGGISLFGNSVSVSGDTALVAAVQDACESGVLRCGAAYVFSCQLADTIAVPADHATIQAAIEAAVDADEIVVAPGTYIESIDFLGKAITLRSSDGPDVTTIDGNGALHVVRCVNGEGPDTVLDGFTITGGNAIGSYPDSFGGGMYNDSSSPTVTRCIFNGNVAEDAGGGMFNDSSSPKLNSCEFNGNQASSAGGGIYSYNSSLTVTNCTFNLNASIDGYGAGMYSDASTPTVTGCTFRKNSATNDGGAMFNLHSSTILTNCMFSENEARRGGAMANEDASPSVTNCTFGGNTATGLGGGAIVNVSSNPILTNCILWGDSPDEIFTFSGASVVAYSDIQGGLPSPAVDGGGNIDADPLFMDVATGDLHLHDSSPAIDAGDISAVPDGVTTDLDGMTRIAGASVDMGAYESVVIPPVAPLADPSGPDNNRFLLFVVPSAAAAGVTAETALQIELATLNHMCSTESDNSFQPCTTDDDCCNGVCETRFTESEGQVRYVNVVRTCQGGATSTGEVICRSLADCATDEECLQMRMCDGTTDLCATGDHCPKGVPCLASMSCPDDEFKPSFLCATTGCEPEYRDWASDLAGGVVHVYGPSIIPARSEYNVRQLPAVCTGIESSCGSASDALMLSTARWADLTADGVTNAQDITAASDKVKQIPSALAKPRTMLIPGILNPFRKVNVIELQNTVDAVKSLPMTGLITGPENCGG